MGASFGHLVRSWGVLGVMDGPSRSVRVLRALLGSVLGPSWGAKGAPKRPQDDTLRPQDGPKGRQDGAQDDPKTMIKCSVKTISFLIRVEAVLGGSWGDLGFVLGSILAIWYWKTYYFVRNDVFEKIPFQDPSWTDLGPIWAPKGVQDGGLLGPKLGQGSLKIWSWVVLRS